MGWGSRDPSQPVWCRPQEPTEPPKPCLHLPPFTLLSSGDLRAAVRGLETCRHRVQTVGVGGSCLGWGAGRSSRSGRREEQDSLRGYHVLSRPVTV